MLSPAVPDDRRSRFPALASALSTQWADRTWVLRTLFVLVATVVAGGFGLMTLQPGQNTGLVWPAAGVALAAMVRLGLRMAPGVWLGALIVALIGGEAWWVAPLVAFGSTLGPLLAAWVLRRDGMHPELNRRRDLWLFCAFGVAFSSLIGAANGAFWIAASGEIGWVDVPRISANWMLGNATGVLLAGVPLLTLARPALQQAFGGRRWWSTSLLILGTLAGAVLAAALAHGRPIAQSPLFFIPLLLLCWMAVRSGLFTASATALVQIAGTIAAALHGFGPFLPADASHSIAMLLGYIFSLLGVPLLTTALTGELTTNTQRVQLALDTSRIGVCGWDLAHGRLAFSSRWLAMLGRSSQDFGDKLQDFWSLVHPDDTAAVQAAFDPLRAAADITCRAECRMLCGDGSWRPFELSAIVAERNAKGLALRIITTARDVSDVQAARERQDLTQSVFQHLHEGLLITDPQHRVLEVNPTFSQITGFSRAELIGAVPPLLRPVDSDSERNAQLAQMGEALAADGNWRGELRHLHRNGEPGLLQLAISAVRNTNGTVRNHVLAITDITHTRQQWEQLQRQAHFDELTRLPNRTRLGQMLQGAMQTSRREGSLLTVCYLDLDHFKPVNDRFGHEAGDRLLIELANRMRRSLRSWAGGDDVVARIGGDEFVLLLRTATLEESRHAVERVLNQVCQPYALDLESGAVMVTASIGATVFPLDGADAETLLRHADHAMYSAKQAGRNGYLFFDAEHDRRAEARFVALGRVQEALDANEFRLFFQPKVDMRNGKVLGVESLLRWKHPDHGVVSPAQFLPLIENTGLSISVGNWVLQHGIEQLAHWLGVGMDITVSINVSARHLQEPLFAQHLATLLSQHDAPVARHLIIEVLETAALADVDYTCALMEQCRELGVRFALDDFGTGYSTFTYLKRLPIDMLKIDRSFVINMLGDRQDLAIVEGVIGLSQTFGCAVVAEGVETSAQAQRLIEIGCNIGQGNGIAAAMPPEQVPDWVRDYKGLAHPAAALFAE
ncbi:MAG TPA: EAL domain-containing protein [Burkholderiaceae bacterium]